MSLGAICSNLGLIFESGNLGLYPASPTYSKPFSIWKIVLRTPDMAASVMLEEKVRACTCIHLPSCEGLCPERDYQNDHC